VFGGMSVDPDRVAIYIRWSTEEQGNGTTLEVQRDACKHFLLSQGWQFREDLIFVDDGYSGANMNRPALGTLRETIRQGQVSAVVVYKLDRLSRNLLDCVTLVRQEWSKVALFSTMEHFDTHSSMGQMVFNILVSFAEFERNVIRERTMSGKKKRREQARNSGFKYPFGYRRGQDGGFEVDPEQAAVVRGMFGDYIGGEGLKAIADGLNDQGIPSPHGGLWRMCTVSLMLENPFYAGHYASGRYSYEDGKQKRDRLPAQLIKNAVPAIVSQEAFDRAQQVRTERRKDGFHRVRESEYMLSTILRCAKCGGPMIGHHGQAKRYYRCSNEKELGTCDSGAVPAEELERTVINDIRHALSPEHLVAHIAHLDAKRQEEIAKCRAELHAVQQLRVDVQRRREKLDADYFAGALDAKQHGRLSERVEHDERVLNQQEEAVEAALREVEQTPVDRDRLLALTEQLDGLAELEVGDVRQLLRHLLASLTAYRPKKRGRWSPAPVELTMEHNIKLPPTA
jgi:site-specific DNA recombinase